MSKFLSLENGKIVALDETGEVVDLNLNNDKTNRLLEEILEQVKINNMYLANIVGMEIKEVEE